MTRAMSPYMSSFCHGTKGKTRSTLSIMPPPQNDNRCFACVRWDLRKRMDLKLQWDSVKDSSAYDFTRNANILTVTRDVLFWRIGPVRH
jgi:hypothetical protein